MRAIVVHDHVENLRRGIPRPYPPEKREKDLAGFALGEAAIEPVGFQVVIGQEVTDIFAAVIVRSNAMHRLCRSFAAMTMAWEQMERAEFVDAQASAVGGPLPVQAAYGPE